MSYAGKQIILKKWPLELAVRRSLTVIESITSGMMRAEPGPVSY